MTPIVFLHHRDETPMTAEMRATLRADVEADLAGDVADTSGTGCALTMGCGMMLALASVAAFAVAWWLR